MSAEVLRAVTGGIHWQEAHAIRTHVASMHPAVALAVADWLDAVVRRPNFAIPEALAVATAYLGAECATCSGRGVWMDEPCSDCGGVA